MEFSLVPWAFLIDNLDHLASFSIYPHQKKKTIRPRYTNLSKVLFTRNMKNPRGCTNILEYVCKIDNFEIMTVLILEPGIQENR